MTVQSTPFTSTGIFPIKEWFTDKFCVDLTLPGKAETSTTVSSIVEATASPSSLRSYGLAEIVKSRMDIPLRGELEPRRKFVG